MKKSILSIFVIIIVAILTLTSCDKQKTPEAFLTREKGWILFRAECLEGLVTNNNDTITNLFDGYVLDCEKDDVIKFNANGYEYMNLGESFCEELFGQEPFLGKKIEGRVCEWVLDIDAKVLYMQPFFHYEHVETCTILNLAKDELKISFTYTLTEHHGKVKPGHYTFVLTYVPAK